MKKKLILIYLCSLFELMGAQHLVVLGPPGSGKGTFSQYYVEKYGYVQISLGDFFRSEVKMQTDFGKKIKPLIENGEKIDSKIAFNLVSKFILKVIKDNKFFILDGFPGSVESFTYLHNLFKNNNIKNVSFIQLYAQDSICVKRIIGRQICPECFKIYNKLSVIPKISNICDNCKKTLYFRKDDEEDVILKRLNSFHLKFQPLVVKIQEFYDVITINTESSIDNLKKIYDRYLTK